MKIVRIYALIWAIVGMTASAIYLVVGLTQVPLTIFGFVISTLVFMGLVAVLPALMDDHYSSRQLSPR